MEEEIEKLMQDIEDMIELRTLELELKWIDFEHKLKQLFL